MSVKLVAVAGGSGSGKTTLCNTLALRDPDHIGIVYLDDFQRLDGHFITMAGFTNWDHPDTIDFDQLAGALASLRSGSPVTVESKHTLSPTEYRSRERSTTTVHPRPLILVDGFLSLYHQTITSMLAGSIFLSAPHETRMRRRSKATRPAERVPEYRAAVLMPMHDEYVEPTRHRAELIINTDTRSQLEVYAIAVDYLMRIHARP